MDASNDLVALPPAQKKCLLAAAFAGGLVLKKAGYVGCDVIQARKHGAHGGHPGSIVGRLRARGLVTLSYNAERAAVTPAGLLAATALREVLA
ncbi:hypothetical protein [Pseudoxanthomonas winnipegensis]|uniref:Uncharacterized protein n=1 Tax=Pseudoxanthomonas winnipegensis TaxID=2480810 RepID=A0A4Q8LCF3_9GAMM|nr:hypothetical protein [Pseudoxanthomonas winnipegensis]TAA26554.1 hypothetical protein EA660_04795 [Pseudoxanthomonas winnipegensis]